MMTQKPVRLWPGVAALVLFVLGRFAVPLVYPDGELAGMLASVIATAVILVWWLFFSRLPWIERLGGIALLVAAIFAVHPLLHPSVSGAGQGYMYYLFSVQLATLVLVVAAVAARSMPARARRAVIAAAVVVACAFWALIRTDGVTSTNLLGGLYHWRWTPTAEQKLLAQTADAPLPVAPAAAATPAAPVDDPAATPAPSTDDAPAGAAGMTETAAAVPAPARVAWPGFRGSNRDGAVRGVRIATDWAATPPVELWRRAVGPAWSSFAVDGDRFYTQEQRGEEEIVACYRVSTGEPIWMHKDAGRFYESNGGAGPRSTPTVSGGRVYSFGPTGILNALDASTGARLWSHNVATDVERSVPFWGFTSSPIIVDGIVVVAASGSLAGYDAATGDRRWTGARQLGSYSSPHLATIAGVEQVLLLSGSGVAAFNPADGALLWENKYDGGTPIVQPAVLAGGDVLTNSITMTGGTGIKRISLARSDTGWTVTERWSSNGLKPYFNDFVVHKGHAYGFDGNILSSINLEDGTRNWKGGRYGNGQMVLLADQDLLLVISEDGELVLVNATTDKFTEVARVHALNGKTWNHPVVVGDLLLVRNGEEMAAFRLPVANR